MKQPFLYLANWKMRMSFREALSFATENLDELIALGQKENTRLVVCPDHVSLYPLGKILAETPLAIGAQNCSNHSNGSFTGQISAKSLHQVGCTYCIIGHSERRKYNHETDAEIAEKFIHLIDFDISPIICVGETIEDHEAGKTLEVIIEQLEPIWQTIATPLKIPRQLTVGIAYEPIWSIGTGKVAPNEHIENVFALLVQETKKRSTTINWQLIYGGSITSENAKNLKKIPFLEGFLIGGASLRFQELKKIVE